MKASDLEKVRDKMQELRLAKMERDAIVCANTINVSVGDTYSLDLHLNSVAPIHGRGARAVRDALVSMHDEHLRAIEEDLRSLGVELDDVF